MDLAAFPQISKMLMPRLDSQKHLAGFEVRMIISVKKG